MPGTVLSTSIYKLIYLSQQPYAGEGYHHHPIYRWGNGGMQRWSESLDSRAHPCLPHSSTSCNCSCGWGFASIISPLAPELQACRMYLLYFHCCNPSAQPSRKLKLCFQGMYLAQRHSVIKRPSKMSTQEQSPCNFHHALKLPALGKEHLGVALQKLKCLKKRLHLSCTHFESCRRW